MKLDADYRKQGLRITVLKAQDGKLTAVWRPGSGAQKIELGLSTDRFVAEDTAHFAEGLRLQALEVHTKPVVIYKLPWGAASGWSLSNGNRDDPTNGHNMGDPLGWQLRGLPAHAAQRRAGQGGRQGLAGPGDRDLREHRELERAPPALRYADRLGRELLVQQPARNPGYPVFFEDKNHAYWRPKVGDALATNN